MTRPHPRPRTGLRPRIAYLVTHLMGSGHLVRTLALARVAAQAGAEALVISGGRPLAHVDATGVDLRQLPPLMSDGLDYRNLLRADGTPAGPEDYADRRARIAALLRDAAPDALVCELHPFGRRSLAAEFETAVEAAGAAPAWVSIRDVLEPPSRPKRVARTLEALASPRQPKAEIQDAEEQAQAIRQFKRAISHLAFGSHMTSNPTSPRAMEELDRVKAQLGVKK